jgi:hypothetical protein
MPSGAPPLGQSVMEGHGYYSAHSGVQRAAAAPAFPFLERAAAEVPLPPPPAPLFIGDFGCAGGANEMQPMALAIAGLRKRRADQAVAVVHTDLPSNDFASLFALVETSPASYAHGLAGIYSYAAGRSLYGPVFADRQLTLGWTAITVHWLSTVPAGLQPDSVYANLVSPPVRSALAEQSRKDWESFLTERARETVRGGQIVVIGGSSMANGLSGAEGLFRMIDAELAALRDAGTLRRSEYSRIFYPTYNRTLDEYLAPFRSGPLAAAFTVAEHGEDHTSDADSYPQFARDGDAKAFAAAYIGFVRAVTEPSFFRWIEPDRTAEEKAAIVAAFYAGLEARIAADPAAATCHWHTVSLRLVRR